MKLQKLSNICLKAMVDHYHNTQETNFNKSFFEKLSPHSSVGELSNALTLLNEDGLIGTLYGSGVIQDVELYISSIRNIEEDTFLKKGYVLIKEMKSLIS